MMSRFDWPLSRFQWWRRYRGGHWERCWVDICWSYIWFQQDHEQAAKSGARFHHVEQLVECESWA
jgi:hypothetical protein